MFSLLCIHCSFIGYVLSILSLQKRRSTNRGKRKYLYISNSAEQGLAMDILNKCEKHFVPWCHLKLNKCPVPICNISIILMKKICKSMIQNNKKQLTSVHSNGFPMYANRKATFTSFHYLIFHLPTVLLLSLYLEHIPSYEEP
jgi:hypothetical protein